MKWQIEVSGTLHASLWVILGLQQVIISRNESCLLDEKLDESYLVSEESY